MITRTKSRNLQGDSNARCTRGRENVGKSNDYMGASPEGSSNEEARAIATRLELQVSPSTLVKKKSKRSGSWSSTNTAAVIPIRGCARRPLSCGP